MHLGLIIFAYTTTGKINIKLIYRLLVREIYTYNHINGKCIRNYHVAKWKWLQSDVIQYVSRVIIHIV
jgi:hypothetical protein